MKRSNQASRLAHLRRALARGELALDLEELARVLLGKEPQLVEPQQQVLGVIKQQSDRSRKK